MPELAELWIMSNYINEHSDKEFVGIRKSKESKVKTDLTVHFSVSPFKIESISRGKELQIIIYRDGIFPFSLICTMGMSGNWKMTETGKEVKHSHLMFLLPT